MTKMTVLHFASPFAFSMPVAPKDPGPLRSAARMEADHEGETASTAGRLNSSSGGEAASGIGRADDERLDASLLDTVLQRYGAHGAGAADAEPDDAA